jgi:hypothetical protein
MLLRRKPLLLVLAVGTVAGLFLPGSFATEWPAM